MLKSCRKKVSKEMKEVLLLDHLLSTMKSPVACHMIEARLTLNRLAMEMMRIIVDVPIVLYRRALLLPTEPHTGLDMDTRRQKTIQVFDMQFTAGFGKLWTMWAVGESMIMSPKK